MAKRRGNSEGSITKRAVGRWEARISLPDGKRKSFYGETRDEVQKKLRQALQDVDKGILPAEGRYTTAQMITLWMDACYSTLRPSSRRSYRNAARLYIIPAIGKMLLSRLSVPHIQVLYNKMLGDGLSPSTVHTAHRVINQSLNYAIELGVLVRNVAQKAKLPTIERKAKVTFTSEQSRVFLEAISGDRLEVLYILAITTGMREGELLGLQWKDIDFDRKVIQLSQGMTQAAEGHRFEVGNTKTNASRRGIALTNIAIEALLRQKAKVEKARDVLADEWDATYDLVFPNRCGRLIHPTHLRVRYFPRLLAKAGLPKIRFHDLRHTAATLFLEQGISPKVVSEMLGHASVKITLDVYSHVLPTCKKEQPKRWMTY